jgi:hypothetical protein
VPPSPVLATDDPVFLHVLRLAGMDVDATDDTLIDCGEGLKVADVLAACYMFREEPISATAVMDSGMVRADEDGWAGDTEVAGAEDGPSYALDATKTQPEFGFFTLEDAAAASAFSSLVFLRGFKYDMNAAAATACEMLAERMKLQFDFNDGSGSYPRSQKYAQTKQCALDLWKKARPRAVSLTRGDTGSYGSFWKEVEGEFVAQDWWAWAS